MIQVPILQPEDPPEIIEVKIALQVYRWRFGLWSLTASAALPYVIDSGADTVRTLCGRSLRLSWDATTPLRDFVACAKRAWEVPRPPVYSQQTALGGFYWCDPEDEEPRRTFVTTRCSSPLCSYEIELDYEDPTLIPEGFFPQGWNSELAVPSWVSSHKFTCANSLSRTRFQQPFTCVERHSAASIELHNQHVYPTVVLHGERECYVVYRDERNRRYGYLARSYDCYYDVAEPIIGRFTPTRFDGDTVVEHSPFASAEELLRSITWCPLKTIVSRWTPTCTGEEGLLEIINDPGFDEER